ncbi:AAA family ATPase [uncultured Xanthomonas sp.]|uniref:AAA family ATPase n=1 Tax=uncultured Xanthomonas sp. TaxID=152831 RepID=UPI0025E2D186|nr:AAA family ATPase [uncultured Xanthomonas sp.]
MIRSIQRLRGFGVFSDFRKTSDLPEFGAKNIIYGWNYSGKTTLSRLFAALGAGVPYSECPGAKFEILTDAGTITDTTLNPPQVKLEVFNSDFIASNLSWTGSDFESILLLGDESIEAQQRIERLNSLLGKRRRQLVDTRASVRAVDGAISESKTAFAKNIKTTLQLVEAFTATHLASAMAQLPADPASALLDADTFASSLRLALTPEAQGPRLAPSIATPTLGLAEARQTVGGLLSHIPAVSALIEHLRNHPAIARWVSDGLALHEGTGPCEFCGGSVSEARLAILRGHFSEALETHKKSIDAAIQSLRAAAIETRWLDPARFATEHQSAAERLSARLTALSTAYNRDLDQLGAALEDKLNSPFDEQSAPVLFPDILPPLKDAFEAVVRLVETNNTGIGNFAGARSAAIGRVRRHFVATFALDEVLAEQKKRLARLAEIEKAITAAGLDIKTRIQTLQAAIDRAQKGREALNERIARLLGSDVIQIEVVSINDVDRFALRRSGEPARNLSDGERTAIAFAYFLTKLKEHKTLKDVIVYIDDPISSLDSNHVFQVYAIIEATFFEKIPQGQGSPKWMTTCQQLFVSTHNFEFFEMLKKLPIDRQKAPDGTRYYLIKRVGPRTSTLVDLPLSLRQYTSEYHYLFSVIHAFVVHPTKDDAAQLLALPNALRRFVELYTYMRLPLANSTVESRLTQLVGKEAALRVTNLLHHFSHLETVDRLSSHTQLVASIESVVCELIDLLRADDPHFQALMLAVPQADADAP